MRLPGINYNKPVQSLGRHDVGAHLAVANAEARALQQWGNVALDASTMIETNQAAEYSAKMSNELSELNAFVKNTKEYDPQMLREAGMVVDDDEMVPAHRVATDYYKFRADQIYQANTADLGRKGKKVLERVYATKYAAGIDDVVGQSIRHAQQYSKAQAEMNFEASVKAGDLEGAIGIAGIAQANGTWDPIYYASKMVPLEGRIQESKYLQSLDIVNDLDELERLQGAAINDPLLTVGSANRMYGAYNTKINRIEKELEAELKEIKIEDSSNALTDVTIEITEGAVLSGAEIGSRVASMRPADRNTALSVWRAQQSKVSVSNNDSMRTAAMMIRGTLLPDGTDANFKTRRDNVQGQLDGMLDRGDLSIPDHRAFVADLKRVQKAVVDTVEYSAVEDDIYLTITGGAKGSIPIFDESGERAVGLSETMWELNERALQMGSRFDPAKWWKQKKPMVITRDIEANIHKWQQSTAAPHATFNNDKYDPAATTKNLQAQLDRGEIDQNFMNMVLAEAARHQKLMDGRRKRLQDAREKLND